MRLATSVRAQTPITPIMVGEAQQAKAFSAALFEAGVFAQAIAFPTVPRGTARLRLMGSATYACEGLEFALAGLDGCRQGVPDHLRPWRACENPGFAKDVNTYKGSITSPPVAETLELMSRLRTFADVA